MSDYLEIDKIARSDSIFPLTIISDRYSGGYSGGKYLAFCLSPDEIPEEIGGQDTDEIDFWEEQRQSKKFAIGKGDTPNEAYVDLYRQLKEEDKT